MKVTGRRAGRIAEAERRVFGGPVDWIVRSKAGQMGYMAHAGSNRKDSIANKPTPSPVVSELLRKANGVTNRPKSLIGSNTENESRKNLPYANFRLIEPLQWGHC